MGSSLSKPKKSVDLTPIKPSLQSQSSTTPFLLTQASTDIQEEDLPRPIKYLEKKYRDFGGSKRKANQLFGPQKTWSTWESTPTQKGLKAILEERKEDNPSGASERLLHHIETLEREDNAQANATP